MTTMTNAMAETDAHSSATTDRTTWPKKDSLRTAAHVVVLVAGAWWLLGQWADVLRPLLLAVFLTYTVLPFYARLRRAAIPAPLVICVLAVSVAIGLAALFVLVSSNVRELQRQLPELQHRFTLLTDSMLDSARPMAPWLPKLDGESDTNNALTAMVSKLLGSTAGGLIEAATAGLYLLFMLLGAEKLPGQIRRAYPGPRGEQIVTVGLGISAAITGYLRAKVISSLILAAGTWIVLAAFGVKFLTVWTLLAFLCNFIPYIGSVVSLVLPAVYACLQLPPWTQPLIVTGLLIAVQLISAMLIEPLMIGRAVGLSPLVILAALAIWGALWGLPGMFLAVPLTVVMKIVFENIRGTHPIAKMME
jgi:AI-2 transport protein TqsA